MKQKFRSWIKRKFCLYDIEDLQIGGHCGCCGIWIPDEIFEKGFLAWGLCKYCRIPYEENNVNNQRT